MFYILDGNKEPQLAEDPIQWSSFMNSDLRIVKQENLWPWRCSTIFLGFDHGMGMTDKPVLFETMVFSENSPGGLEQKRYASYIDAAIGHEEIAGKYRIFRGMMIATLAFVFASITALCLL